MGTEKKQPIGFVTPTADETPAVAKTRAPRKPRKAAASASDATQDVIQQLAAALKPNVSTRDRWVGVRNISSDVIGVANPVRGQPDLLALHTDFINPEDPTRFLPNPNAVQVVPHNVWMQLRRGNLYERGMIVRDDSILGDSYTPAEPDRPSELAPGWAKNAVPDPVAFIERSETELRAAIEQMTSEQSLKRLLTAYNMRIEKERKRLASNGDEVLEAKALRAVPAIYHLAEELVLARLEALGYR